ncbi:MAG TPA: hypothetical protein VLR71_00780 [Casimicrobiaceae bacterium]|nr:hypothetical protein [Casimicrobiaceae bacterium]
MSARLVAVLVRLVAIVAAAGFVAACSAEVPNPFASFDARCAKLPAAVYDIAVVPMRVDEVHAQDVAWLTARSKTDPTRHRTFGLTMVSFGHDTHTELRILEDRSGRACGTPTVHVQLSMQPAVVYLARELDGQACDQSAARAHEQRHVAVYRAALAEAARRLRTELPDALGDAVRAAATAGELRRRFDADLREYLARFMAEQQADMAEQQAQIDTTEEYERVAHACAPS